MLQYTHKVKSVKYLLFIICRFRRLRKNFSEKQSRKNFFSCIFLGFEGKLSHVVYWNDAVFVYIGIIILISRNYVYIQGVQLKSAVIL